MYTGTPFLDVVAEIGQMPPFQLIAGIIFTALMIARWYWWNPKASWEKDLFCAEIRGWAKQLWYRLGQADPLKFN